MHCSAYLAPWVHSIHLYSSKISQCLVQKCTKWTHIDSYTVAYGCGGFAHFENKMPNIKLSKFNADLEVTTAGTRAQSWDLVYQVFDLVEVGLDGEQVELVEIGGQRQSTGAQEVENVPERGTVAVDEKTAVLVDRRRQRAAEHGAEHRARIARKSGARRRVSLAADVQPYQLVHCPTLSHRLHVQAL